MPMLSTKTTLSWLSAQCWHVWPHRRIILHSSARE